jgi:hypothetical protein
MAAGCRRFGHIFPGSVYPIKQPIQRGGIMYNFCELQYLQALAE